MHGTYDEPADAVYLQLVREIRAGEVRRQVLVEADGRRAMVVLDFDDEDRLLASRSSGHA